MLATPGAKSQPPFPSLSILFTQEVLNISLATIPMDTLWFPLWTPEIYSQLLIDTSRRDLDPNILKINLLIFPPSLLSGWSFLSPWLYHCSQSGSKRKPGFHSQSPPFLHTLQRQRSELSADTQPRLIHWYHHCHSPVPGPLSSPWTTHCPRLLASTPSSL